MTRALEQYGAAPGKASKSIKIRETANGYAVHEVSRQFDLDATLETVLRYSGLAILLAAGALWVIPSNILGTDLMQAKLGLSIALILTGFVFYWLAARGLKTQMCVDSKNRRIVLAYLNNRGRTRHQKTFTMRDLESFYIKRTKNPLEPASLHLRLRGVGEIKVASGSEEELNALHERMCADLQPARRRLAERQEQDEKQARLLSVA